MKDAEADASSFLETLARIGIGDWLPKGRFVPEVGVWVTGDTLDISFPESGVGVFERVDDHSFWFRHRNEVISDVLKVQVPEHLPFFEVGSGSGVVVDHIRKTTNRPVASVEPIPAGAVAVARRGVPVSFCGDLESLDLPNQCLPALGAFDVIEHLADPRSFLAECRRVLRSDGRLILTVPAYPGLWSEFDVWNGHFQRFTRESMRVLLSESGFSVSHSTYFFSPLLLPAYVQRVFLPWVGRAAPKPVHDVNVQESLAPESKTLNGVLLLVHRLERAILRRVRVPFGTSILVVAVPKSESVD